MSFAGGQAMGAAGSLIHGQSSESARQADLRVPWPTSRSIDSSQEKSHRPRGKFRAFLKRIFGRRLAG